MSSIKKSVNFLGTKINNFIFPPPIGQKVYPSRKIEERDLDISQFQRWVAQFRVSYDYKRDESLELQQRLFFLKKIPKN